MRAWWVAWKSWREILREPQLLGLTLALPLIFMLMTKATYGGALLTTHRVLVFSPGPQAAALLSALEAERYADGRPVFALEPATDRAAAEVELKAQRAAAVLTIDPDGIHGTIEGDATAVRFYRAGVLLNNALSRYAEQAAGRSEVIRVVEQTLTSGMPQNEFDLYAPGMMMFAILMIIPQTAMLVARELRWRTLRRLRLTRLSAAEFLGGIALAQLGMAVVQVGGLFAVALALGFHNYGTLGAALGVGLAVALSAIGMGVLVACFVENDSQAANVGSTFSMVQVFLSGSFFAFPPLTLFTVAGHSIDWFDFIPATHGFLALQQVLCYGADLSAVGFRLGATVGLSLLYLALGVGIFRRTQLHR